MATAAIIHGALHSINLTINIRNMCVLLAPIFAANTAIATYLMTSEVSAHDRHVLGALQPGAAARFATRQNSPPERAHAIILLCLFRR